MSDKHDPKYERYDLGVGPFWCVSLGHEPRLESMSYCRWTVASGDGGPKPGHRNCVPMSVKEVSE